MTIRSDGGRNNGYCGRYRSVFVQAFVLIGVKGNKDFRLGGARQYWVFLVFVGGGAAMEVEFAIGDSWCSTQSVCGSVTMAKVFSRIVQSWRL